MKWLNSHILVAYILLFLIGGTASYGFINLNEAKKEQQPIIVKPAEPIVVRDTVTIETVKWKTPIYKQCCCQMKDNGKHEKKQEKQERVSKEISSTQGQETTPAESPLEGTQTP